jgi:hypothetical protein
MGHRGTDLEWAEIDGGCNEPSPEMLVAVFMPPKGLRSKKRKFAHFDGDFYKAGEDDTTEQWLRWQPTGGLTESPTHQGETVADYLAAGGTINTVAPTRNIRPFSY